jgi:hypothetical protein
MKHSFVFRYSSSSVSCRTRSHEHCVYDIMTIQDSQAKKYFRLHTHHPSGIKVLTRPQGPAAGSIKT